MNDAEQRQGLDSRMLITVGVAALLVRLLYIAWMDRLGWAGPPTPDSAHFKSLAHALVAGRGYAPDAANVTDAAFRPPLYVWFLAGAGALFGESELPVRVLQAVLGAIASLFVAGLAGRIFNRKAAYAAGLLAAFHPQMIQQAGAVLSEGLFTYLYLGALYLFGLTIFSRDRGRTLRFAAACGLFLGLAVLCRPTPLPAIPILMASLLLNLRDRPRRRRVIEAAALGLCSLLVIAPWILRDRVMYHAWIPVSTNGEFTFYLGNSPEWGDRVWDGGELAYGQEWDRAPYRLIKERPPGWFSHEARRIIAQDPGRFARFCAIRTRELFRLIPTDQGSRLRRLLGFWDYTILFPLGMIGLFVSLFRRNPLARTMLALVLAMTLVHIVSIANMRYRAPFFDVPLLVYAGGLSAGLIARLLKGRLPLASRITTITS